MIKIGRGETNHLYVDVDGTLLIWPTIPGSAFPGETPKVNTTLVESVKRWQRESGGMLVIWTMGGLLHARMAADLCGFSNCVCLGKPDLAIDDAPADLFKRKFPMQLPADFCAEFPSNGVN